MDVRTRFAPSPTGGLHIGGVRTALFSYLFAKKYQGKFVLRIEDTDQTRFVDGAEEYILDCLNWCGISPDESPFHDGNVGPYRQSERKNIYKIYAQQLVENGYAYYAFDTPAELEAMREKYKSDTNPSPQYDHKLRLKMKNSLSLSNEETKELLENNTPSVIRLLIPENKTIQFQDMIRGEISNDSNLLDDKVLLKADGMPTYHLAVVVDDYLMKITHAFRGEEWLPSAPIHILLWEYLGWKNEMPQWAHLPLILKPDGYGKLSKRDGDRLGFPVFAMNWTNPQTQELSIGFKEIGFMPEAFINMLVLLGWSAGDEQEIFTKEELIEKFSIEKVHKGGAKFDFEKAKWINHEWIKRTTADRLLPFIKNIFEEKNIQIESDEKLLSVITLIKDRCHLLNDFIHQGNFFFQMPASYDIDAIKTKWNDAKLIFFNEIISSFEKNETWTATQLETQFKELATNLNIKIGELQMLFRIMLVGAKFGPSVFQIAELLGKENTIIRMKHLINLL